MKKHIKSTMTALLCAAATLNITACNGDKKNDKARNAVESALEIDNGTFVTPTPAPSPTPTPTPAPATPPTVNALPEFTSNPSVTVTGTAPLTAATVRVSDNSGGNVTVNRTPEGTWTATLGPYPDGLVTFVAVSITSEGAVSGDSNAVSTTVDSGEPAPPVLIAPPAFVSDNLPEIIGEAEPLSTITVLLNDDAVGTTPTPAGGVWTFVPTAPLADGVYVAKASATDRAGNISSFSEDRTFTVDTTEPPAPVITPRDPSDVPNPTIAGTAEPASTVRVFVDGEFSVQTVAVTADWEVTLAPLAPGEYVLTATATDTAGNVSPLSAPVPLTILD